jgi:putative ABC transport system permease protein
MFWETTKLALLAIRRNALRSFLTLLGIVIGVGAVIAMVSVGRATTAKVTADLSRLGSNLLVVRVGQSRMGRPGGASAEAKAFKDRDVEAMRQQLSRVKAVAPIASAPTTAVMGGTNWNTTVTGTNNDYFVTQDWPLAAGRMFLQGELRSGRAVCIIGATVRTKLFGALNPIGQNIRLKKLSCEVIGLLTAKGQSSFGRDQDDTILIPLRTFQRRIAGNTDIATIFVSARDGVDTAKVQADIEYLLRERRKISPGEDDNFHVRDLRQIIEAQTSTTTVLTGLLGAVAAVSLLVGGIGIMNIMLVSVTERTREIGIRLAIGALEYQVLMQFLVEALVLSLMGGVLGVATGLALAVVATQTMKLPFVLDPSIILIAFAVSALIGIVFGYFPARRAARLDPIEALRHE